MMNEDKNILERLGEQALRFFRWLGMFKDDVSQEAYKKVVGVAATAIIGLFIAILTIVFAGVYRWWENYQDEQLNYVERTINGVVRDEQSNEALENVRVAIVGDLEYTTTTDNNGFFYLEFKAHRDSSRMSISLLKEGYITDDKRREIPRDKDAAGEPFRLTITKSDRDIQ